MMVLFFLCFLLGPALYFGLWQVCPRPRQMALFATLCGVTALFVWAMGLEWSQPLSIGLVWLSWVAMLTAGGLTLRAVYGWKRVGRALGAMGVTLPWFGFATAQMMVG